MYTLIFSKVDHNDKLKHHNGLNPILNNALPGSRTDVVATRTGSAESAGIVIP